MKKEDLIEIIHDLDKLGYAPYTVQALSELYKEIFGGKNDEEKGR